jgi:hypothetical protein
LAGAFLAGAFLAGAFLAGDELCRLTMSAHLAASSAMRSGRSKGADDMGAPE